MSDAHPAGAPIPAFPPPATGLRLPALFGNRMVLQAGLPVPVWGWSIPSDEVTVCCDDNRVVGRAGADGRWIVKLPPMGPGRVRDFTVSSGKGAGRLELVDVAIGEVWLCSGQSNMAVPLTEAQDGEVTAAGADWPDLRLLRVPERASLVPQLGIDTGWVRCTPETARAFSAIGLHSCHRLQQELGVPIGMIQAAFGGTVAEAFMSPAALSVPAFAPILRTWERFAAEYPATAEGRTAMAEERRQHLLALGKVPPPWPLEPKPADHFHRPSAVFHGMIEALIPAAVRGVLWYQGEANGWRGHQYRELFPTLIADWRRLWMRPELPFLFVQLPGFAADWLEPDIWPELREAQMLTARRVPHTAMIQAIDLGDPDDLHPRRKREVGERLALAALATVHGRPIEYSGPLYRECRAEGERLRLFFDHTSGGLISPSGRLSGFTAAGPDRSFAPVRAILDGETVVIDPGPQPRPAAVRYAWANDPEISLYNRAGLPASPFRTDDWPGITEGRVEPEAY